MEEKSAKKVASGALLLVSANFIVKIIGFVYRIPIGNILGDSALGYFSTAFEIYTLLLTIFISGGAIAVSKMISESTALGRWADVKRIIRFLFIQFAIVGFAGSAIMYFFSERFARFLDNSQATLSIMWLAPAIFFLAIACVFRGFFQGMHDMRPSSLSEVVEALCKLIIGIAATLWLRSLGSSDSVISAGAISGTTFSIVISSTLIVVVYFLSHKRKEVRQNAEADSNKTPAFKLIGRFWKLAIPIALSSMVVNLTSFLDLFLIFDRLTHIGMTEDAANKVYGAYKGYAQSLFNLFPSIISSIGVSILPALSAAYVTKKKQESKSIVEQSIKAVNLLAFPSAVGLFSLAGPILRLLYHSRLDQVGVAVPILMILAIASYWTCLSTLATSLLQSTGKTHLPLISLAAGGITKLIVNYFLVGTPSLGINGAPIGTLCCYIVMTIFNLIFLKHVVVEKGDSLRFFSHIPKPLISSVIMGICAWGSQKLLSRILGESIATIIAVFIGIIVYVLMILVLKGVTKHDILMLPGGKKISRILNHFGLLKEEKNDN